MKKFITWLLIVMVFPVIILGVVMQLVKAGYITGTKQARKFGRWLG